VLGAHVCLVFSACGVAPARLESVGGRRPILTARIRASARPDGAIMILHSVRIDCSGVAEDDRRELEEGLAALADIDVVAWLRVGRDIVDPHITGLLTVHEDAAALEAYRVH